MEPGNSTAGHGDEHEWPDGKLVFAGIHIGQNHFRHDMTAYAHEHAAGNTQSHDDQADTENGVETGNNFINRKKSGQEIVNKNNQKPGENLPARKLGKKHGRAGHEYGTYQYQKDNGEETHNGEHGVSHVAAYDFRNTVAVFPDGHHAGEVIMDAAGKNSTQHNPEIYRRPPESTAQGAENRAKACNVQELDEKYLPRGKRHVVNTVIVYEGRCPAVRRSEKPVHDGSVN